MNTFSFTASCAVVLARMRDLSELALTKFSCIDSVNGHAVGKYLLTLISLDMQMPKLIHCVQNPPVISNYITHHLIRIYDLNFDMFNNFSSLCCVLFVVRNFISLWLFYILYYIPVFSNKVIIVICCPFLHVSRPSKERSHSKKAGNRDCNS